jgi:peptidoglycan/LPS O-acetylase OafA/YrhL
MTEPIGLTYLDPPSQGRSSRRIKGLDVLRGLAASAVVVYHYTFDFQRVLGHRNGSPLFSFKYGSLGVQLFFIISGFVIFMTLNRCRTSTDFVRSRFSRLFPPFWCALALTAIVLHFCPIPKRSASLPRIAVNLTMVPGLFGVGTIDPVYWTLQVELLFYGMMLLLFATGHLRRAIWFMLGLLAFSLLLKFVLTPTFPLLAHHHGLVAARQKLREILILDYAAAFLVGMVIYENRESPRWWHGLVVAICLGYTFAFSPRLDFWTMIAFGALVYLAAHDWLGALENRVFLYLGFISYSLYLTHQNIGFVVIRALEDKGLSPNTAMLVAVATALLIATAMAYGVEQPALRLLRKRRPAIARREMPQPVPL